jgi:hypothetical protein
MSDHGEVRMRPPVDEVARYGQGELQRVSFLFLTIPAAFW